MRRIAVFSSLWLAAGCVQAPTDAPAPAEDGSDDANLADGPSRPLVTGIGVPDHDSGVVALQITVRDRSSPTVDLLLVVRCDGGSDWDLLTTVDPITDLATDAAGVMHTIHWSAAADVEPGAPHACLVAVIATDPGGLSSETMAAAVELSE